MNLNPHDVLKDVNIFIGETKESLYDQWIVLYDKHAPVLLTDKVDSALSFIHSDKVWPYYEKYQKPIDNLLIGLAILILLRVVKVLARLVKPAKTIREIDEVTKVVLTEKDFETIPICVGKGDAEELLLIQSYADILKSSNDEDVLKKYGYVQDFSDTNSKSDLSILNDFSPSRIDSPNDFTASDVSAIFQTNQDIGLDAPVEIEFRKGTESPSLEDSFERAENILDNKLESLNSSNMVVTPSYGGNSIDQYSTSPSKLIYKKTSISILTNNTFPTTASVADTTVGDITEETVYSEPFAGDENTSFKDSL